MPQQSSVAGQILRQLIKRRLRVFFGKGRVAFRQCCLRALL
mgnify:CR=1 FL=1